MIHGLTHALCGVPTYPRQVTPVSRRRILCGKPAFDAPSGTAVTLAELTGVATDSIESIREGEVPGTHILTYESGVDKLELTHEAKSREGFALGAVVAAEFMQGKKGYYTMSDLLKIQ